MAETDLIQAFALSRLFFAFMAFLAAVVTKARHKIRKTTKELEEKLSPFVSHSDLIFLAFLVSVWMLLYVACVWEGLASDLVLAVSAPLGALESVRYAVLTLPEMVIPGRLARAEPDLAAGLDAKAALQDFLKSHAFEKLIEDELRARGDRWAGQDEDIKQELEKLREAYDQSMSEMKTRLEELSEENTRLNHQLSVSKSTEEHAGAEMEQNAAELERRLGEVRAAHQDFEAKAAKCCKSELDVRSQVAQVLSTWMTNLANDAGDDQSASAFKAYVEEQFMSKKSFDEQVQRMTQSLSREIQDKMLLTASQTASESTTLTIERILSNATVSEELKKKLLAAGLGPQGSTSLVIDSESENLIVETIQAALRVYDADKTGMFDFALESAGGTIASTRCTESHDVSRAVYSVLGIPIWWEKNNPRTILQPGSSPGQCWAFKGSHGAVVVKMSRSIYVEAVTLEHIPRMVTPDGTIRSAPARFAVYGLNNIEDLEPIPLGNFTYLDNNTPVQTFSVNKLAEPFDFVELKVLSNYGHPIYTCLYRFRVHGKVPST